MQQKFNYSFFLYSILTLTLVSCQQEAQNTEIEQSIDRHALVNRHNVKITAPDTLGSLSVGNGEFAFTVDASGLQSFPEYYENGIALGTQSQWGWHSVLNSGNYSIEDVAEDFESCNDLVVPYATQHNEGRAREASNWLRTNPHRLHLGLIGLEMLKENGEKVSVDDLQQIEQELNLWTGKIESSYEIEGVPVKVELYAHPEEDQISVKINSPLLAQNRMKVGFRFPYGSDCHVCPGYDWQHPEAHQSKVITKEEKSVLLERTLDTTHYYVQLDWEEGGAFTEQQTHHFNLSPAAEQETLAFSLRFSSGKNNSVLDNFESTQQASETQWEAYWTEGAAIDFSECTDPRAEELERRVVLSQYLTKIQCSGSLPPQETGLTMNSWYGKFHLEMHWWHGVHFALWDRIDELEKSMHWYSEVMENARETAQWQGYEGVRWQKMTGPAGRKSPSSVGELLAWQQPHPIYFAELFYRQQPDQETLQKYKDIVFETAEFMASFAQYNENDEHYHLCHPIIPAQEIFHAEDTDDPPFELAYWKYALSVAQDWRERLGMERKEEWQAVIDQLAPLPLKDSLYLPNANAEDAYIVDDYRRDHPIVMGAYGILPGEGMVNPELMAHTFDTIFEEWNWETTWGWDYPMMAMSAARLDKPNKAIDALFMDVPKNTYLVNGHNYQDKRLRLYLPGNGGLLTAVAMMAAGWDGAPNTANPGFPDDGSWNVHWEGLKPMP